MDNKPKKLSCSVCQKEIPESSKATPEGAEYAMHFCSDACHKKARSMHSEDLAHRIGNPESYYDSPQAVLNDSDLSDADKFKILQSWENDALEILKADEENMSSDSRSRLSEIKQALLTLQNNK